MGDNITIFVEQWLPNEIEKFVKVINDAEITNEEKEEDEKID